jgi:hypothetical protein
MLIVLSGKNHPDYGQRIGGDRASSLVLAAGGAAPRNDVAEAPEELVEKPVAIPRAWYHNARRCRVGHTVAAAHYANLSRWFGGAAVVLATVAGTTLVTGLSDSPSRTLNLVAAILAALAAVAAAFQTFAGFDKLEMAHHKAAVAYSALQREFDEISAGGGATTRAKLDELGSQYNAADEGAPALKRRVFRYADRFVRDRGE